MAHFTRYNTEGYDAGALAVLNARFESVVSSYGRGLDREDLADGSVLDHIAETVLADYDRECPQLTGSADNVPSM